MDLVRELLEGVLLAVFLAALVMPIVFWIRRRRKSRFPKVGEVFTLTAKEQITGLGLVSAFGHDPKKWHSTAPTISAGTTRRFKLIASGLQRSEYVLDRVVRGAGQPNNNGCWLKVFSESFGSNGVNFVGVLDSSWENPSGILVFPMVDKCGNRDFFIFSPLVDEYGNRDFFDALHRQEDMLWLVEVE